ncbi:Helix-turn-helix [Dyadobacter psychrophilus]|uniref:Helix-turn-helix n=2 Tax=Dyadobacter psychrophilus TaxID=651661 RepID=A0A1T5BCA9_9BACT|nr:Helix-turn-helix [Dyadobacter psychrophilus]
MVEIEKFLILRLKYLPAYIYFQHTIMNIIASNLLTKREEKRLTQAYMAFLSGMSQPNYSDIERGKTRPSIDQLKRFSEILDVSVDELISEVKKQKIPQGRESFNVPKGRQSALLKAIEERDKYIKLLEGQLADLKKK